MSRAKRPLPHQVDAAACRACGREELGLRCSQAVTDAFQRNLARVRTAREREALVEVAPCAERCPLSLCIQGYAGHIAAGELSEALGHVLERTALPESVCRVCDRPCESGCVRTDIDDAVAINDLKRYVVDWATRSQPEAFAVACAPDSGHRVAVVGSGPAGLSAAQELRRRGHAVTLLEAADRAGGLLTRGIPAYRLPPDAVERDIERLLALGVELKTNTRLGADVTLDSLLADGFDAVVLAVGAGRGKSLALPGDADAPMSSVALDYLKQHADGAFVDTPERVLVIGGGNAAIDAARTARRRGASSVTVACIEAREAMPALAEEVGAAEAEGIRLVTGVRPLRTERGSVVVQVLEDRRRELQLAAELVVFAVGQDPDLAPMQVGGRALARTADGLLAVDAETLATSDPRIFAAGDVIEGPRMVTSAMALGMRAAWGVDKTLRGAEIANRRAPPLRPLRRDAPRGPAVRAPRAARRRPRALAPAKATLSFDEIVGVLDAEAARAEAERCLQCGLCGNCRACIETFACPALTERVGRAAIEPSLCIACRVCELICSNQAIGPGGVP